MICTIYELHLYDYMMYYVELLLPLMVDGNYTYTSQPVLSACLAVWLWLCVVLPPSLYSYVEVFLPSIAVYLSDLSVYQPCLSFASG